jgi:hypothetical protein
MLGAGLHEPLARQPLLAQEHAAKLRQPVGRIVEGAEDPLPVLDRQGEDHRLPLKRALQKGRGRLVDQTGERANGVVRNADAGELLQSRGLRRAEHAVYFRYRRSKPHGREEFARLTEQPRAV